MTAAVFNEYYLAIDVLSSEEQLFTFEAHFAPHMKKEDRKNTVGRHKSRIRNLVNRTKGKLGSIQDVAKAFARMRMNG